MAENIKIEKLVNDDGRRVETRAYEVVVDGQKERIIETHVEQVPMVLSERIVEKIAPVVTAIVTERKKEIYDTNGKILNTLVEPVVSQSLTSSISKEDLIDAVREVLEEDKNTAENKPAENKPAEEKSTLVKYWDFIETAAYVVISGELAFCLYHLLLKNWL